MKSKKQYIAPELTVVSFRTERGYALSGSERGLFDLNFLQLDMSDESYSGYNAQGQQTWATADDSYFGSAW